MAEDVRESDLEVQIVDNHIDVSAERTIPSEIDPYAEIKCDCGRWVELIMANIIKECDCGRQWTMKAAKVKDA